MPRGITTSTPEPFAATVAGEPFAVAATRNFEARPAVAYDGDRRLWLAWEQTRENWGKDFGGERPLASEKQGVSLYLQRELKVRVLHKRAMVRAGGRSAARFGPTCPPGRGR